jgi:DNA-binding NarL/FixJ family response regulator
MSNGEERYSNMKSGVRILIVDDNDDVRRDLQSVLQMVAGIQTVGTAGNGREAVEQVKKLKPDVVIMDLEMPVMDGLESTREIKSLGLGTRVIILSVHKSEPLCRAAAGSGADGYVEKGAPLQKIKEVIFGILKTNIQ